MGDSLGGCDHEIEFQGRSEEEEQQSEDLYSGNCSLGTHGKQLLRVNEVREMSGL